MGAKKRYNNFIGVSVFFASVREIHRVCARHFRPPRRAEDKISSKDKRSLIVAPREEGKMINCPP
jgi:hypothetical protein